MKVIEKKKPRSIREWIAVKLVRLAQWLYPESEAVLAFYTQLLCDEIVYGKAIVRVNPRKILESRRKAKNGREKD